MARAKIAKKGTPKKKIQFGQALVEMKESFEKSLTVPEGELANTDVEPVDPPWGPFLSLRQTAFVSCYLDPSRAAGDLAQACKYAGISQEVGRAFLEMPHIRARINAAMGDVLARPEMIKNSLVELALGGKDVEASAKVRALELLAKIQGMMIDRSISAAIDLNDPDAAQKIDDLIKAEYRRVTGKETDDEEGAVIDAEIVEKISETVKPEMRRCLKLVNKATGATRVLHGALQLASDGVTCLKCETRLHTDPEALRVRLQKEGYRLSAGTWYRPKHKSEGA